MSFKLAQLRPSQPTPAAPTAPKQVEQPMFDTNAAMAYNIKSKEYFKTTEADIKRILGTSADWTSKEFAEAVYDWQKNNGFAGKWVDGKFGPATMGKMTKVDSTLAKNYDAYAPWKLKHTNEKPYKQVASLTSEVDRLRKEMGATDIPLSMLMGWMQVESGGKLSSRGLESLDERGLFQISRDEAKAIGADHDKIANDQEYSIRSGIMLAQHHAQGVDRILSKYPSMASAFSKGSDMYWRLVFFTFSAGGGTTEALVARMAQSGETFSTWDDVMKFAAANPSGFKHSPIKWSYHVNRAFNLGNQMAGTPQAAVASAKVLQRIKNAKWAARKLILDELI